MCEINIFDVVWKNNGTEVKVVFNLVDYGSLSWGVIFKHNLKHE